MLTRPIPSSGEAMPVIGFGTWQTFDVGPEPGGQDRAALDQRRAVLQVLFDAGGRMIDSSPMYGRAEAVVGQLLTEMGARDKAFIATKVWTSGEQAGIAQMRASAAKMAAPVIDLMQIHNLVDWKVHLKTTPANGRTRAGSATSASRTTPCPRSTSSPASSGPRSLDFVQLGYSINVREAEARLFPLCQERGVAVIANQPFDSGNVFRAVKGRPLPGWAPEVGVASWAQLFLKYILGHPAVTCAIPGTGDPAHARDNVAAGFGPVARRGPAPPHAGRVASAVARRQP